MSRRQLHREGVQERVVEIIQECAQQTYAKLKPVESNSNAVSPQSLSGALTLLL